MTETREPPTLRIGVGVIVWRRHQVLLGQRLPASDEPCWQFPGGRLEAGESILQCAARELLEETGLQVERLQPAGFCTQPFQSHGESFITLYVSAHWRGGEAKVIEKDKCDGWRWFDYRALPQPLFEPINALLQDYGDLRAACALVDIPADGHR